MSPHPTRTQASGASCLISSCHTTPVEEGVLAAFSAFRRALEPWAVGAEDRENLLLNLKRGKRVGHETWG